MNREQLLTNIIRQLLDVLMTNETQLPTNTPQLSSKEPSPTKVIQPPSTETFSHEEIQARAQKRLGLEAALAQINHKLAEGQLNDDVKQITIGQRDSIERQLKSLN